MLIKDVINKINTYNIKIDFYSMQELKNRLSNQGDTNFICFSVVNTVEKNKYEKSKNFNFITTTPSIQIPNISIAQLLETLDCVRGSLFSNLKETVKPFVNQEIQEGLLITLFLFLHEVGHYEQLKKCSFKVKEYVEMDIEKYKEIHEKCCKIETARQDRLSKGSNCVFTFNENTQLDVLDDEYRKIPKEAEADEFAISNLEEAFKKYYN